MTIVLKMLQQRPVYFIFFPNKEAPDLYSSIGKNTILQFKKYFPIIK